MVRQRRISLLVLLVLVCWAGSVAAATVQAVADRDRIASGESLQLQLRVSGSPDGEPDLSRLEQSWEILGRSQSSQMQIINGNYSRSLVYTLTLLPRAAGALTIPAICFAKDCSLPLPIEVSKTPDKSAGTAPELLLESGITPQQVVSQGQLLFKVRLLRRVDLLNGQLSEPKPTGVTAVVKKLGDDRSYETRRDGRLYQVIERDYAIYPQGSGELQIPALQFDGTIASGRSRFNAFGQPGRRVRRNSQPLTVEVASTPADLGQRPWIPATALSLLDDWQDNPPQLTVGEPATRTLRLSATGVPAAQLPELKLKLPEDFKSYPDQPQRDDQLSGDGITGVLEQKIALVPTRPGRLTLPALDLDWWDVTAGRWRRAHLAELQLEVAPAAVGSNASPSLAPTPPEPSTRPTAAPPSAAAPAQPAVTSSVDRSFGFWPWLSLGLAAGWLLTLLGWYRRISPRRVAAEPLGKSEPAAEKSVRREVRQAAECDDPQATRQALVRWGKLLYPDSTTPYEQLVAAAPPGLANELSRLDHALYGGADGRWTGHGLSTQLKDWQPPGSASRVARLPELYP
jgi:BatD DUF11 like domain